MTRDPFGPWTTARRVKWSMIALVICFLFAPRLIHVMQPPKYMLMDFYQEWSSARNVMMGRPVYSRVEDHVEEYVGIRKAPDAKWYWDVNVHPPTSVVLAIPIQGLEYPTAFLIWNIGSLIALAASLWLVIRALRIHFSIWSTLPLLSVLLVCDPLYQQVIQGQLNLILLLLLVGIWLAARNDRPLMAGALLALATAIKLFPGFLIIYFVVRRQWKAVAAAAVTFGIVTAATCAIVGVDAYKTYVLKIVPQATTWKAAWNNASIAGFWHKLFDPESRNGRLAPLWESPELARLATALCVLAVVAILVRIIWKARSDRDTDLAFGLTIVAMLLVSPVTWEHYFLLLLIPLAVTWVYLPASRIARWGLTAVFVALCAPIIMLGNIFIPGGFFAGTASVTHTLTLFSFQCYALCGLFALGLFATLRGRPVRDVARQDVVPLPDVEHADARHEVGRH